MAPAGAGMLELEAIIQMWAGVTSDAHGFGDAVQCHGRTDKKHLREGVGQEQNFFPAGTQHHILPSLVSREAVQAPAYKEGPRPSSGLLTQNPFRRDFNLCK